MLTYLVTVKATSIGNECHQLADSTNGSDLIAPSMPSLAITPMTTLADGNMVAPCCWAMERLWHPFPLLAWTPRTLDAGSGLLYLDRQESLHVSSVHTDPMILLLSKPAVSGLSINPTSSVRMAPAHLGWHLPWPCDAGQDLASHEEQGLLSSLRRSGQV